MSATYDPALPAPLDRMRFLLGDTVVSPEASALIPDETYLALLSLYGESSATGTLAWGLATKYAQQPTSIGTDGDSFNWSDRVKTWQTIAQSAGAGVLDSGFEFGRFNLDFLEPTEAVL